MDYSRSSESSVTSRQTYRIFAWLALALLGLAGGTAWWAVDYIDSWAMEHERGSVLVALTGIMQGISDEVRTGKISVAAKSTDLVEDHSGSSHLVAGAVEAPEGLSFGRTASGELALFQAEPRSEDAAFGDGLGSRANPIALLNVPFLDGLAAKASVHDLRFTPILRDTRARIPVYNDREHVVGWLVWSASRPAQSALVAAAPAILAASAVSLLCLMALLTWLARSNRALEASRSTAAYLALHDPLTGLANRTLFERKLRDALALEYVAKTKVAVISIDLDRFKEVNDTLGHDAGDCLMKEVSRRLSVALSEEATLARLGGDEFALVQPGIVSDRHAEWIGQSLLRSFEAPFLLGETEVEVTASLGVALEERETVTPAEMMRRADLALYSAKLSGRNRYGFYDPDMDQSRKSRRLLHADLREALRSHEGIFLLYQPIYGAASGQVIGAEALVRWLHPTQGLLPPDLFIGIAEETGLINQLGLRVIEEACKCAAQTDLPWIAVNVSPLQFRDLNFADRVLELIGRHGLSPDRLQLEITEGVLLQNSSAVQVSLRRLRSAGIWVALDDFGTGYSSISHLRTHEVDKLKIDKSFVQLLGRDPAMESIIRSIVEMSRSLHMQVTAEGVEEESQREVLVRLGCDHLQGYLLSRPVESASLVSKLPIERTAA